MAEDGPDICIKRSVHETRAAEKSQLWRSSWQNELKEMSRSSLGLVLDPSLDGSDGRMDAQTSKIDKQGRGRKTDRQTKGPRTYDDGSTCPIQDVVPLVLLRGPSTPS